MADIANKIVLGDESNYCTFETYSINVDTHIKWINKGEVVAGSTMSKLFNDDIVNQDIDIYFHSLEDAKEFASVNCIFHKNAEGVSGSFCQMVYLSLTKINLIWGIPYDSPKDLISRFDIRACSVSLDPNTGTIYAIHGATQDCIAKQIVFNTNPRSVSVARLLKYVSKGFSIDKYQRVIFAELIKLGRHSNELELITGYVAQNAEEF
jgi:hypothetical protein